MSRMSELEAKIDQLVRERDKANSEKMTGNPFKDALTALQDHINVQVNAHPNTDLSDLADRAAQLDENVSAKQTDAFRNAVQNFVRRNGTIAHDLGYVTDLAEGLHQSILDKEANVDSTATPMDVPDASPAEKPVDDDDVDEETGEPKTVVEK